jgi:hypothetical protein
VKSFFSKKILTIDGSSFLSIDTNRLEHSNRNVFSLSVSRGTGGLTSDHFPSFLGAIWTVLSSTFNFWACFLSAFKITKKQSLKEIMGLILKMSCQSKLLRN